VQLGLQLGDAPTATPPREHLDQILRLVEEGQSAGFSSFYLGMNHLMDDSRWLPPIPVFARLAAELDEGTRLVTNVLPLPLLHPVSVAEDVATLDIITGGRLTVGVGPGYRPEAFEWFGVNFADRFARMEESLELLKLLWTGSQVDFEGRFWAVRGGRPDIRPVQQPRPPVIVGATGDQGFVRAARIADGVQIPPKPPAAEVRRLISLFEQERDRLGLPGVKHATRREVQFGADRPDGLQRLARLAHVRYASEQATHAVPQGTVDDPGSLASFMSAYAVVGTPDDVVAQLRQFGTDCPVDPLVVRGYWAGSDFAEALRSVAELGSVLVPALADL
jgi:alkanesulfonate monooxygenase SsuD/methylene tetrahydromethanopterin reductase-like flavin-dependent oxidoreductase (luciferase family)